MQVGFIGAGNMARAIARGWGDPALFTDTGSGRAQQLVDELGGEVVSNRECAERADLLILAHKPYHLEPVAEEIGSVAKSIVVSILGNTALDKVAPLYPEAAVFRVEPNTPVEIRKGVTAVAASGHPFAQTIRERFERLGAVVEIPERLVNVAGAVSGVGPAYWALFAEAFTDTAIRHGLPAAEAATLVRETMAGTAALLNETDTLALRRAVTSPGGSTARGLAALERGGVRAALAQAMDAVVD
jgi:pyrroline-5-carboxylate reductase